MAAQLKDGMKAGGSARLWRVGPASPASSRLACAVCLSTSAARCREQGVEHQRAAMQPSDAGRTIAAQDELGSWSAPLERANCATHALHDLPRATTIRFWRGSSRRIFLFEKEICEMPL